MVAAFELQEKTVLLLCRLCHLMLMLNLKRILLIVSVGSCICQMRLCLLLSLVYIMVVMLYT